MIHGNGKFKNPEPKKSRQNLKKTLKIKGRCNQMFPSRKNRIGRNAKSGVAGVGVGGERKSSV